MSTGKQSADLCSTAGNLSDATPANPTDGQAAQAQVISLLWQAASQVPDPELPFLQIGDLGILRDIRAENSTFVAYVSPTYTGCPAVSVIEQQVASALQLALDDAIVRGLCADIQARPGSDTINQNNSGWHVRVERQLSPAWTTDWITQEGHRKLKANGIAPPLESKQLESSGVPAGTTSKPSLTARLFATPAVDCPHCGSAQTERLSEFGSTPCKSQHRCLDCSEPFDHFKCLR